MKFIDENHIEGEMSDKEFDRKVDEEAKTRDFAKYGQDGHFQVFEEAFNYKGLKYFIRVNRYYTIRDRDYKGMNKIGKWAVLEYDKGDKRTMIVVDAIKPYSSEFLWADTLHAGQEDWPLERQVESMQIEAKIDIDNIQGRLDEQILQSEAEIKKLKQTKDLLKTLVEQ